MTRTSTTSGTLTKRYVTALLDAAAAKGQVSDIAAGAQTILKLIHSSADLQKVLASPLISVTKQTAAVMAVLQSARVSALLGNFVGVVLKNRRGAALAAFLQATLDEIARRDGRVEADVQVASPINDIQQKKLADMIAKWSGGKVNLNIKVTPEVLGGMKIRVGSIQIDDSVAGKLERLRQNLLGTTKRA